MNGRASPRWTEAASWAGRVVSKLAPHGWIGLVLISVMWPLNWGVGIEGLRTHMLFFPLWLGYALVVDALVLRRRGSSILTRSPKTFCLLFLASAPAWWLFELINWRTQNWEYTARAQFGDLEYFFFASICFATVMPAVFGTAELVRSARWMSYFARLPKLLPTRGLLAAMFCAGVAMLALLLVWPTYFYPFIWGIAFFFIEPFNAWRGRRSLFDYLCRGDWRPVAALMMGALICGFFWEMWNIYSSPKWTYSTPGVEFLYIFEMPLLGYLGYLPFALELYALLHLLIPGKHLRL